MPIKDPEANRAYQREWAKRKRARAKLARQTETNGDLFIGPAAPAVAVADPAQVLADWCEAALIVPPGHALAGQPMTMPAFARRWFCDTLAPGIQESLLTIARKNAKSAILAAYLLARLVGPLQFDGYRAGIVSVSKEKAGELKMQMQGIAKASRLEGLTFYRSPAPGRVESKTGRVDILAADSGAGHASGFDDSLIDELGLLQEKHRDLVHGMRTALSAKGGRFLAISIQGDSPFTAEMIARDGSPGLVVHRYAADEDCALDDESQWHQANPGLAEGIKSLDYMRSEVARVLLTPADQPNFRAHDLNLPQDPSREMICSVADWRAVEAEPLPPRDGYCYVGFDAGVSHMSGCTAYWPATGRLEGWAGFPSIPDLAKRGEADGVGARYQRMQDAGELALYPGRSMRPGAFLADCLERLRGSPIRVLGSDRYRRAEVETACTEAGYRGPIEWRGTGAAAKADGSHDVRAFQRAVLRREMAVVKESVLWRSAIRDSDIQYDRLGNPYLDKARKRSRIDCLQAGVISLGLAELDKARRKPSGPRFKVHVVG